MSPYSSESDKSASGAGARECFLRFDRCDERLELLRCEWWLLRSEWLLDRGNTFIPFSLSEEKLSWEPSEEEDPSDSGAVLVSLADFLTPLIAFELPLSLKCIRDLHFEDTLLLARLFVVSIMVWGWCSPSPCGGKLGKASGAVVGRGGCAIVTKRPKAYRQTLPTISQNQGLFYLFVYISTIPTFDYAL